MIIFAPFYKQITTEPLSKKLKNRIEHPTFSYLESLKLLEMSFKKYNTEHDFIVCSDLETVIDYNNIFRTDTKDLYIMEAITVANTNFVKEHTGKIVLAGADHLVRTKIDEMFSEEFDLGFWIFPNFDPSHRVTISMSIVLINSHNNNKKEIENFFNQRQQICFSLDKKERHWFADQKSISLLLETQNIISDYHKFNGEQTIFKFGNLKIKLFKYGIDHIKEVIITETDEIKLDPGGIIIDFPGHKTKNYFYDFYKKEILNKD